LNGETASEYVSAHGLPEELEELLQDLGGRTTWTRFA
jgi:hypothetical protein